MSTIHSSGKPNSLPVARQAPSVSSNQQVSQIKVASSIGALLMRQVCGSNYMASVVVLPEYFMDPQPPPSIAGYDLSSQGEEVVHNLTTEITCRSEQGIKASSEQALQLKANGRNVSATFALNNEQYSVLAEHVLRMSEADIPVRIVAGDKAPRSVGRENGTIILERLLAILQAKVFSGVCDNTALKKLKLKVCYHDGSELQFVNDKIQLASQYESQVDEISMQLQPLDRLEENLDLMERHLNSISKGEVPIVCYAIVFANQLAYERVPQRIKDMAGHGFHDQEAYLKRLKSILGTNEAVSVRLSLFGFSALHWRVRTSLLKQYYALFR